MKASISSLVVLLLSSAAAGASTPNPPVALVTGANRGIGLALSTVLAEKGWRVIATCRDPEHAEELRALAARHPAVTLDRLDVTDDAALDALAARYRGRPIDLLINNAGILGDPDAQQLGNFDQKTFEDVMRVNAFAPLRVAQAFLDNVAASRQKKIVTLTSGAGSLATVGQARDNYFYRMSKSASNMSMLLLQNEVRSRGVIVALVSPGPVDTQMNREWRHGAPPSPSLLSPLQSATAVVTLIEQLTPERAAHALSHDGREIPW
ncbi:MAG TPA: SDR family NAD(P)-dependent oxidoreductase [Steroidobacteraceae bacterium]|nr:SDR family NAD(P)-dependent oxidoreductase [Steroidobacteraceae bacterium]